MAACRALFLLAVVVVLCCGQALAQQQQQQKLSWRDSPQFRRFQDALEKRVQAPRMKQAPATGLVPGDIVIAALVVYQGAYIESMFVLNGSTLELKGSLQAALEPLCDYLPGGFSFTPDQTQLVMPCYKLPAVAAAKDASTQWNIVAIDTKNSPLQSWLRQRSPTSMALLQPTRPLETCRFHQPSLRLTTLLALRTLCQTWWCATTRPT